MFKEKGKELSDVIHRSLVIGLGIEETDIFHIFRPHDDGEIIFSKTYANRDRQDLIVIRITMVNMFSFVQKKIMYQEITRRLMAIGIRRDDILVCVLENNGHESWSLGEQDV
ncbi:hypothetical protein RyT2_22440 [Pseudolactococcus yaeyamensis]